MEMKDLRLAVAGLCGVCAGSAMAIEPAALDMKGIDVIPLLSVQLGHNDNILSEATDAKSSTISVLNPSVQFIAERNNDAYRVTYDLAVGTYHDSHDDDYVDHTLTGEAIMELDSRNRLDLTAAFVKGHEARGTTDGPDSDKPARYTDKSLSGVYRFGAADAQGNLELAASYLDHNFDNLDGANDNRERDNFALDATFFYRVAPKTRALFEVRREDIDYKTPVGSALDNIEMKYLVGVNWDATAKTSGTAKLGYHEKDYDSAAHDDQDTTTWEVGARWEPTTYSTFDLTTSQDYEESSGEGDGIDTQTISLAWNHAWNKRFSTQAMLSRTTEDYVGAGETREDKTNTAMVGFNYELQRWLSMNMAYTYTDNSSSEPGEGYDNNLVMFTLQGSL